MIVVDASVILEVLLQTQAADTIEARMFESGETLHVPHLTDLEVAQVLRRYCRTGELSPERGRTALQDLHDLPLIRYPHDIFLPRIWDLRHNVTAYDAVYIALAEVLPATFLTCDTRLASAPGHEARIEVLTGS